MQTSSTMSPLAITEPNVPVPDAEALKLARRASKQHGLFAPPLVKAALRQSLVMLRPDIQWKNPVMFVVEVGTVLTLLYTIAALFGFESQATLGYLIQLDIWLVLTLLFANFASSLAEARGKAQADALRQTRRATPAFRISESGGVEEVVSTDLKAGDKVEVKTGQVIPGDGEIIEGVASIDESAITGESAPVIREAGGDRSGVTGGTRVLSDRIIVRITVEQGQTFLDRMIALVEGAARQRTPNEIALSLVLAAFTLIFLIVTATLWPMALHAELYMKDFLGSEQPVRSLGTDVPTLVALLVCLIPTTSTRYCSTKPARSRWAIARRASFCRSANTTPPRWVGWPRSLPPPT
jgi:K+-transporting ATPase ATPase B chain